MARQRRKTKTREKNADSIILLYRIRGNRITLSYPTPDQLVKYENRICQKQGKDRQDGQSVSPHPHVTVHTHHCNDDDVRLFSPNVFVSIFHLHKFSLEYLHFVLKLINFSKFVPWYKFYNRFVRILEVFRCCDEIGIQD